ncbi:signal recognition particle, SRP9/SRP14 subunit [Hyaloraphidium curvatum]|nr:signal recognition particle, SRP9/SRP14 subunit [Hyaloraphidium curvatum]
MFQESNDLFLNSLSTMYQNSREKGTVWVTMKRYSYIKKSERRKEESAAKGRDSDEDMEDAEGSLATDEGKEYPCIVRAVSGKRKLSTLVHPPDMDRFLTALSNLSRVHMDALKKKERVRGAKRTKAVKAPKSS